MTDYLLAIDEGTTGATALLRDSSLRPIGEAGRDFAQHFPRPGWVEHDPDEIWAAVAGSVADVLAKTGVDPKAIAAIGITNQRETLCFWDRRTGAKLANAIVWQDRRTAGLCDEWKSRSLEERFREATGLLLDPYFSATKAAWAIANWPHVARAAAAGNLAVGTIDSYLLMRLTGDLDHATEPSNASRTLCFSLAERRFDPALSEALGLPPGIWPTVKPSRGLFGRTRGLGFLPDGIPITGMLGDQQSALLGQACTEPGEAKCTYGTGAFLLFNTGRAPVRSSHRLLSTVAWDLGVFPGAAEPEVAYALEGSVFIAGAAVQWFRDGLGAIRDSAEIEALARSVPDAGGVTFVPALTGLGAPYWRPDATGLFDGLTRGTTKAHLARAILDGIAFQVVDLVEAMERDVGRPLRALNVDGGASANDFLMRIQADLLGKPLRRPASVETTALGALYAAGLGAGIFPDLAAIRRHAAIEREFEPALGEAPRAEEASRWRAAITKVIGSARG